ncbi:hypothetical protein SynBOUM118_02311 [Synechococcus sp. BOUM118]|nr:hypothetical protein SynBOUM118_02311 [Synechococcus sp. BOUM118]
MSGFTIFLRGEYEESNVLYPYEGWDEIPVNEKGISVENFDNKVYRVFTQKVLDNLDNKDEFEKLEEMFQECEIPEELQSDPDYDSRRPDYLEGGKILSVICPYGTFEVSFKDKKKEDIELDWDDLFAEDVEQPSLEDQLSKRLSPTPEFCFVKVWENSGGWIYESDEDEEFDQSKIHYVNGDLYYGDIDKLPLLEAGELRPVEKENGYEVYFELSEFEFTDGDGNSSRYESFIRGKNPYEYWEEKESTK